jgi:hypothetical protein
VFDVREDKGLVQTELRWNNRKGAVR